MLRAFRARVDPEFDARHDLLLLRRQSQLALSGASALRRQVDVPLGELFARWKNDYRYCSADRLARRYRRLKLWPKRGDILEWNARIAVDAAARLVALGATQWTSQRR